ncbi:MAG: hypothetical protein K2O15_03965 [Lachnospiraceae bacterium]|nr:hypothetical protein [Lachnospiraceae bacterium]
MEKTAQQSSKINPEGRLIYYFEALNGMQTSIRLSPEGYTYMQKTKKLSKAGCNIIILCHGHMWRMMNLKNVQKSI